MLRLSELEKPAIVTLLLSVLDGNGTRQFGFWVVLCRARSLTLSLWVPSNSGYSVITQNSPVSPVMQINKPQQHGTIWPEEMEVGG